MNAEVAEDAEGKTAVVASVLMRAKVRLRGLEPVGAKQPLPFDLVDGVVPWTALEPASVQRNAHFRPVLSDGTFAKIGLLPISVAEGREAKVAMRLWRRAMKQAWESASIAIASDFRPSRRDGQAGSVIMALGLLASLAIGGSIAFPVIANDRGALLAVDLAIGVVMLSIFGAMAWANWRLTRDVWSKTACVHATLSGRSLHIVRANDSRESFNLDDAAAVRYDYRITVEFNSGSRVQIERAARFRYVLSCLRDELDPQAPAREARALKWMYLRCLVYFALSQITLGVAIHFFREWDWLPKIEPQAWKLVVLGIVVIPSVCVGTWFVSIAVERRRGFWRKKRRP